MKKQYPLREHWLPLVLMPALALRVWLALYPEPLWYDEGFSVVVAQLPWRRMLAATAGDVHPPTYYVLLKVWLRLTAALGWPVSPAARLMSVLFSVAALGLFWLWLSRLTLPQGQRKLVLMVAAYMPGLVFYAAEARMYSVLTTFVMAALYALWRSRDACRVASHVGWLLLAGYAVGLAALTHNVGLLYAPVIAVAYGVYQRFSKPTWAELLVVAGAAIVTWVPWLPVLLAQMQRVTTGYWINPPTVRSLAYALLRAMSAPPPYTFTVEQLTFVLVSALTTWGAISLAKRRSSFIVVLALGVPTLALAMSHVFDTGLLIPRLIIPALPFFALLWAGLLQRRDVGPALLGLVLLAFVVTDLMYVGGRHNETRYYGFDELRVQSGDIVYGIGTLAIPLRLYGPDVPFYAMDTGLQIGTGISTATLDALNVPHVPLAAIDTWERAWVYYYDQLPAITADELLYFEHLALTYPHELIAEYSDSIGDDVIVRGGLWLLTNPNYADVSTTRTP